MENKTNQVTNNHNPAEGVTETELEVVSDKIYGFEGKKNIYLILWERIANNGLIYCYADSEEDAYENFSFKYNDAVRHTIIKLDRNNMPVTDGKEAN